MTPTLEDVRAAAARIASIVHRTPVATSSALNRELHAEIFFKCENLQKVGAFKARGATNAVLKLDEASAARGVVTHSSGNHGAALAFAAARRGIPCIVVMPRDAPSIKIEAVRGYGAEIVFCERTEREAVCGRVLQDRGATLIHPFEHPDVVAGQGTAALELLEQVEGLDRVIAPVGGGGLLSGTTISVLGLSPATRVWGAEPRAVDDAARSLASGKRQALDPGAVSWADGLMTRLGELPFEILHGSGVEVVTVEEKEIVRAAWWFVERMKIVVEPSAATVLAALRSRAGELRGARVGAILSGGNTDFRWLDDPVLSRG